MFDNVGEQSIFLSMLTAFGYHKYDTILYPTIIIANEILYELQSRIYNAL